MNDNPSLPPPASTPSLHDSDGADSLASSATTFIDAPSSLYDGGVDNDVEAQKKDAAGGKESVPPPPTLPADADPLQWSHLHKWLLTLLVSSVFINCTLASSMGNAAAEAYERDFGASQEVAVLVLSLYMLGFCLGPLLFAPLSESFGGRVTFLVATPCFALFNVGCALSTNMHTLLVLRVFAGFFGGCPQSIAGATIADVWSPAQRQWSMLLYTLCAFGGPVLGPMAGGFLTVSGHWRWLYWLLAIFAGVNTALLLVFQRETYAPLLLRRHNNEKLNVDIRNHLQTHLSRPFTMLFNGRELPLIYAAAWTAWSYALLFIFFEVYPVIYGGIYGFNAGESGLCFFGFGLGILLSIPVIWLFTRNAKSITVPEDRLVMLRLTAPLYVIGFLWFGWSARSEVHWIVSLLGTVPIGTAVILSFNALSVYVSQCYTRYAASALAAMAFSRCLLAIFMPLFARQMYQGLRPGWASTILAIVSLLAVPVPFIFARWGATIRNRSKLAIQTE